MNITLIQRIQTKSFDTWLNPDANGLAQMMKAQGVLAYSLFRNADKPNEVVLEFQFPDRKTLNAYQVWFEAMAAEWVKAFPGSEQKVVDNWVGENIPSHSRTL